MAKISIRKVSLVSVILVLVGMIAGCSASQPTAPALTTNVPTTTVMTTANPTTIASTATTASVTTPTPATTPIPVSTTTTTTETTATETPFVFPTEIYTPAAEQYTPTGEQLELFQYVLSLINNDRQAAGLPTVVLAYNAAAEKHAQDMFDNYYLSHWGTDGLKPYMRYTLAGGLNNEGENSAYSGWFNPSDNPDNYQSINVRDELASLQHIMVYDDAASNWAHRDTMLNKSYTRVSLGIVYDTKRVALVQQFEGDYVEYYNAPTISNGTLSLIGRIKSPNTVINNVSIAYDPEPQTLTNAQLTSDSTYTDGYSLGEHLNSILPPPPAGTTYSNLSPTSIIADKFIINDTGQFAVQADVHNALTKGKGVYTIVIVAYVNGVGVNLTNYSVIVK